MFWCSKDWTIFFLRVMNEYRGLSAGSASHCPCPLACAGGERHWTGFCPATRTIWCKLDWPLQGHFFRPARDQMCTDSASVQVSQHFSSLSTLLNFGQIFAESWSCSIKWHPTECLLLPLFRAWNAGLTVPLRVVLAIISKYIGACKAKHWIDGPIFGLSLKPTNCTTCRKPRPQHLGTISSKRISHAAAWQHRWVAGRAPRGHTTRDVIWGNLLIWWKVRETRRSFEWSNEQHRTIISNSPWIIHE